MRKSILNFSLLIVSIGLFFIACESNQKQDSMISDTETQLDNYKNSWNDEDYKGVKAAIEDYVEGLYQVDSTRIERSVDSTLRKLGYWYNPKDSLYRDNLYMSYNSLVSLAARWNKDGSRVNETTPKEIEIYDINSKTASAKLTAAWGIDYFHLGKVNGQWKIFNVIWQSMPENE